MRSKIYEDGHVQRLQRIIGFHQQEIRRLDQFQFRYHQREVMIRRLTRQLLAFQEFRRNAAEYRRQRKEIQDLRERNSTLRRTLRAIRRTRRQLTADNQDVRRWNQVELTTNSGLRDENIKLQLQIDTLETQLAHQQTMLQTVLEETAEQTATSS